MHTWAVDFVQALQAGGQKCMGHAVLFLWHESVVSELGDRGPATAGR